jgi:hypothetical protein
VNDAERLRRRRCRAIPVAVLFGVLLPLFQRSWLSLGVAAAGIAVLVFIYVRECRRRAEAKTARDGTDT